MGWEELPSGPVVRVWRFYSRGLGSTCGQRTKIPCAAWPKNKILSLKKKKDNGSPESWKRTPLIYASMHVVWEVAWHTWNRGHLLVRLNKKNTSQGLWLGVSLPFTAGSNPYCVSPAGQGKVLENATKKKTCPRHNFGRGVFLSLITAFSYYPRWHRRLRDKFSAFHSHESVHLLG